MVEMAKEKISVAVCQANDCFFCISVPEIGDNGRNTIHSIEKWVNGAARSLCGPLDLGRRPSMLPTQKGPRQPAVARGHTVRLCDLYAASQVAVSGPVSSL